MSREKFNCFSTREDWERYVSDWAARISGDDQFSPLSDHYCGWLNVDPSCDSDSPAELWVYKRVIDGDPYVIGALRDSGIETQGDPGFEEILFVETELRAERARVARLKAQLGRSLYERLHSGVHIQLNEEADKYPAVIKVLFDGLAKKYSTFELTVAELNALSAFSGRPLETWHDVIMCEQFFEE